MEQQDQHDVDAQNARQHRHAEALEQIAHGLGIAYGRLRDTRWQRVNTRQRQHLLFNKTQRLLIQLDLEVDVALAVVAVDLRRPAADGQRGHVAQHHRPPSAGNGQAFQQGQVGAGVGIQLHHDRHLALAQVQLGQRLVVVTGGGNAQGVGNRRRRDAQVGRARKVGPHDQLRAHKTRS